MKTAHEIVVSGLCWQGMALCQKLATVLGGYININSTLDGGTRVDLILEVKVLANVQNIVQHIVQHIVQQPIHRAIKMPNAMWYQCWAPI